jgi:hypothetical protein
MFNSSRFTNQVLESNLHHCNHFIFLWCFACDINTLRFSFCQEKGAYGYCINKISREETAISLRPMAQELVRPGGTEESWFSGAGTFEQSLQQWGETMQK